MTDMNTILGLGQDLVFEGKRYRVSDDLSFSVQADFERWLKSQVMQDAMDVAGVQQDRAEMMCRLFMKESGSGMYRFNGEIARAAMMNNTHASVKLFSLLLEDGKRKAGKDAPDVSEQLAARILADKKAGPWALGLCLVAVGLDPTSALALANGLVMTRAEMDRNQKSQVTLGEIRQELSKRLSGDSSESAQNYLLNYLNSLGEE